MRSLPEISVILPLVIKFGNALAIDAAKGWHVKIDLARLEQG